MTAKRGFMRQPIQETVQFYKRLGMSKATAISKAQADFKHMGDDEIKEVVK